MLTKEIQDLKEKVYQANLDLPNAGLVKLTWGNVSTIDRDLGVVVIKPSGLPYEKMTADRMVVTDLDGNSVEEGQLNPSSDLLTHVVLYKNFVDIKAVVHTHSKWAVSWRKLGEIFLLMEQHMLMHFMVAFHVPEYLQKMRLMKGMNLTLVMLLLRHSNKEKLSH